MWNCIFSLWITDKPVWSYRGDWVCTLCRSDQEPVETYECENMNSCGGVKAPYALSNQDQRVSFREESVWLVLIRYKSTIYKKYSCLYSTKVCLCDQQTWSKQFFYNWVKVRKSIFFCRFHSSKLSFNSCFRYDISSWGDEQAVFSDMCVFVFFHSEVWEADSAAVQSHTQCSFPRTCQSPGQSNRFTLRPLPFSPVTCLFFTKHKLYLYFTFLSKAKKCVICF